MRRLLIAGVAIAALTAPAQASAAGGKLTISPLPGTPDANPSTQISILGAPRSRIERVSVTGSVSGAHSGKLRSYSGHRGASFLLAQPLQQGETVSVSIRVRGHKPIHYSFNVANLGPPQTALSLPARQPDKLQSFVSEPNLSPPIISIHKASRDTAPGDVMLTPLPSPVVHPGAANAITIKPVGPGGPMIIDNSGNLVWFHQVGAPEVAADLRVQDLFGKKVLTWWQGVVTPTAFGIGGGVIANHRYQITRVVHAGNGYAMDIHEFHLTNAGDALLTAYSPILVHLAGTPAGQLSPLLDSIVQEVDVKTGLVVWEWHAYGHIPLSESQATPQNSPGFDAYHLNSIQPLSNDRVLVSARDTSTIYCIRRSTGRILWRLGGTASSFRMGPGTPFYFQHDANLLPKNRVSLYDDGAGPPQLNPFSRGLILKLDWRRHVATVAKQFARSPDTSAQSEGSMQRLDNGNAFVGFGSAEFFSEFSPKGALLFDGSLPADDGSYRSYRFPWRATPTTPPALAVQRPAPGQVSLFASWNGATDVARWRVLADGARVATVRKTGFETRIDLASTAGSFSVQALDSKGRVIGRSGTAS
jgi:hypothetical protein